MQSLIILTLNYKLLSFVFLFASLRNAEKANDLTDHSECFVLHQISFKFRSAQNATSSLKYTSLSCVVPFMFYSPSLCVSDTYTDSTVLSTVVEAMKWPYNFFCTFHQLLSVFSKYLC